MLKVTLLTLGNKMPLWVEQAVREFSTRLREACSLTIVEIPSLKRGKSSDSARIMEKEMALMTEAIPPHTYLIALDIDGDVFSSELLARKIDQLLQITSHICFLIGGPEGLSTLIRASAHERWSLSPLTLPHTLARVVLLEALYRSFSILRHHPYHK